MAVFTVIHAPGKYHDPRAYYDLINYVLNPVKSPNFCAGSRGVSLNQAAFEMECLSQLWNKNRGLHLRHMVLSFAPIEEITPHMAYQIGMQAIEYYGDCYQILFAVHENTGHLHIHIVMNTVNYHTGQKYPGDKADYHRFIAHLQKILSPYDIDVIPARCSGIYEHS